MPLEGRDSGNPAAAPHLELQRAAWRWAVLVLVLGLGMTQWRAINEHRRDTRDARQAFVHEVDLIGDRLKGQLEQCEHLIRAFQSIFLASRHVSDDEYARAYANMQANSPVRISLQALAYAERRQASDGEHWITTLFAPHAGNSTILGLDVRSQPNNLIALHRSRDNDQVAMSAPFRLRQSQGMPQAENGFILRLPVYEDGISPKSLQERREAIIGSVGASFRISTLIGSALTETPESVADMRVVDVTGNASNVLYQRHFSEPTGDDGYHAKLEFGGRVWEIRAQPSATDPQQDWLAVLWVGSTISLLLAALTWSLVSTRERAIALSEEMGARFRASEERFRKLNELLPNLVVVVRQDDGEIVYRNAAARDRLANDIRWSELHVSSMAELAASRDTPSAAIEMQLRDSDDVPFWASVWISGIELDGAPMWLLVASDISEQRQLTERLSYQASHDSLTRLFNRHEFESRVQHLLEHGVRDGALLFIDLDQFKLINDTSGHRAGDELLVRLAAVMREELRPDDVLGRLGGDEFGVLLAGVPDIDAALQAAERLRRSIERFIFGWEQRSYTISASIGVILLANAGTMKELFAHADAACYLAKEAGRNRIHVYAEDDVAVAGRLGEMEWANRLRDALRDDRLLLDYQELRALQPRDGGGSHVELLLRLRGEDGGEILPGAFLPAAERYGLMPLIDRWVVETALGNLDHLHPDGTQLATCSINLSAASLEDAGLVERIAELVAMHQIAPQRLLFEITETVAMRDFAASSALLSRLRGLGCRVALDDFGAGMSSFGYLKNLALDVVKIDGSFVQNMVEDRMSQSIVRAVTEICHQQELQVVAEWVSSPEMLDMLAAMNIDYAQGFFLHRPERVLFQRGA